jgi:hypothetical protein
MSNVTILASGRLSAVRSLTVELIEADETPAVIILARETDRATPATVPRCRCCGREAVRQRCY